MIKKSYNYKNSKKITFAIIGAGKIAEEYIKVIMSNSKEFNLIGISGHKSKNSKKLSAKYGIKIYTNKIEDLLKQDLDIIIVAVSIPNLINVSKKLIKFKGIILFEKPLGKNYSETKLILNSLNKNKKNCYVALNRRSYQNIEMVYGELKKDNSKKIITVFNQQDLKLAKKIGHSKEVIKNWMYANSIHLIDLLVYFGQSKVTKIIAEKNIFGDEKLVFSKIKFKNGNMGFYYSIWNRPGPWLINISSSTKYYELNPLEQLKIRSKFNNKNILIKNEDRKYKPGFQNQIFKLAKIFNFKRSNKSVNNLSGNNVLKSMPTIEEYYNLSLVVKKIYKI